MAKANSAFMKPMQLSDELEAVVGKGPLPRSEVVKKLWEYIKKHNLQDQKDKRVINCDDKLKTVFKQGQVHMMKMGGLISKHLS
jgi:upstream activation factor subunit UAF30